MAENGTNGHPRGCALITGASRGIGAAIAMALARDGWACGVNYRSDAAGAAAVVDAIAEAGGRALPICHDVSSGDGVDELFGRLEDELGPVLVLVNNAGTRADKLLLETAECDWSHVIDTNLSAAFHTTKRALRPMLRARFGRVINIASVVGPGRASPGQANYAASKAGLVGFTKTVAAEVARRGVTVNVLLPGLIETQLVADVDRSRWDMIPARRAGRPEEVAACARFLASADASYVTGATVVVDGGLTA